MLKKPLREEQADMKLRWSDPAYQWANDPAIRRRYLKETHEKVPASRHDVETTLHSSGKVIDAEEGETK
jgi:hypothetical protein